MPATATDTIPALTIFQPYPELILRGDKKVENRCWHLGYRGPLVIHAGQSRKWLETYHGELPADMEFGAILGVVDVVHCFRACDIVAGFVPIEYNWLTEHKHVSGPWCIVLANPRRLREPIPYRGAQKLWRVPRELVAEVLG